MNPTSKSPLPVVLDPVAAAIIAQLKQTISEQDQQITRNRQALVTSELMIQKLKEALRLERIKKYGVRSEKLTARGASPDSLSGSCWSIHRDSL